MKLAAFDWKGGSYVGRIDEQRNMVECLRVKGELAATIGVAALIGRDTPEVLDEVSLDEVTLRAPVPIPHRNIFCVGKNYHAHAKEFATSGFDSSAAQGEVPAAPIVFSTAIRFASTRRFPRPSITRPSSR